MNVLIYTKWFFPVPGGTQTVVRDLANGISNSQFPDENADKIRVVVVTETKAETGKPDSYSFEVVRRPPFFQLLMLMRKADVIHLAGPVFLPLICGLVLRKPVVIEHHGFQSACPNGLLFYEPQQTECPGHFMAKRYRHCFECNRVSSGPIKSALLLLATPVRRWLSNRVRANITPTQWLAAVLSLKRNVTIPHGVAKHGLVSTTASSSTFAFQGRLVTSKGIEVLLSAAKLLAAEGCQFRVRVIGDGPELELLKSRIFDLNGRVEFLGHLPERELENALSDVGAVIMPSLGGEVFGLVAAENMARGKLLIVSRIGALEEVVGETGFAFETGNPQDLAGRMREAMANPERTRALGEAARLRSGIFDPATMVHRHILLYREVAP
jgi:glycosyltransferase involved in cell wall biosynthesis